MTKIKSPGGIERVAGSIVISIEKAVTIARQAHNQISLV
jgi:hypothetical protein